MKNIDVRNYASSLGVKLWEIAEKLNIHDSNFSRILRKELTQEKKEELKNVIDEIAKERIEVLIND